MLLHEQSVRTRRMHGDAMNAVTHFCCRLGNVLRVESLVDWLPRRRAIVGPECAGSRNRCKDSLGIALIEKDRVQAHPARARLPLWTCAVAAKSSKFVPRLTAICGAE